MSQSAVTPVFPTISPPPKDVRKGDRNTLKSRNSNKHEIEGVYLKPPYNGDGKTIPILKHESTELYHFSIPNFSIPVGGCAHFHGCWGFHFTLRAEFLWKTDSGYPKDKGVNKPWQPLGIPSAITPIGQLHQSPPSPIPGDLGRGPSHQSTCSNIDLFPSHYIGHDRASFHPKKHVFSNRCPIVVLMRRSNASH